MSNKPKPDFQLVFAENLKRDTNLSTTPQLAFDDLGDFIEERKRLQRTLERCQETQLRVDYSEFGNHVFFDSAVQKFNIAKTRILTSYPFNGTREEKESFHLTGSGYESYVFDEWPRFVGYLDLDGSTQHVSASDVDNILRLGSSSLYVSAWVDPVISDENLVLQKIYRNDNLIKYSNDFEETEWIISKVTISASSIAGPFPGTSGSTVVETVDVPFNYVIQNRSTVNINASGSYICSGYFKASNRNWMSILFTGTSLNSNRQVYFDIAAGTVGTITSGIDSAIITDVGNGWYRTEVKLTTDNAGALWPTFNVAEGDNDANFSGSGEDAWYVYGAHLQEDSCPSFAGYNYVATTGSVIYDKSGYELIFSGATDPHLKFTIFSGATELSVSASYTAYTGSFNNIAAIYDEPANLVSLYINDKRQVSSSVSFGSIESPVTVFTIGSGSKCANAFFSGVFDFYSGSVDEVRVAHTASELFHVKNFSRPINAGGEFITGSAKEFDYLKLYYPFNEGVVGTASFDQSVIDYSKNGLHGKILNYANDTVRVSGAVMFHDPGEPTLYSFHSDVVAFTSSQEISGTLYDNNNNNFMFNMIAEQLLIEDDNADGLLSSFTLAMARFFDELKLYIDQFDNIRITNYKSVDETPDILLPMLQRYFGWKVTEHFGDASALPFFFGEEILSSSGSLEVPLFEIRNQFWRRILNNIPYLYKTKGKRHNLDAFFNVLGINRDNIRLKEYGYLPGGSIQDDRVLRDKTVAFLGIGTGSFGVTSGSFVRVDNLAPFPTGLLFPQGVIVETMVQLPFISASYSGSLLSGALWQFDSTTDGEAFRFYWVRDSLLGESGKFVLESTSGSFSSSDVDVFNGDFIHVSAGRFGSSGKPFIGLRGIDGRDITLSEDFIGSSPITVKSRNYDFIMGANSGSTYNLQTQGFFGEYRVWKKILSGSELDDHALHFESVGVKEILEDRDLLLGHWALNEDEITDTAGELLSLTDLSRAGKFATGSGFPIGENPYQRFVREYNHLSPSIDLKWTENKIRIRNKTELKFDEVASDTNEVSLEFNLVDSLNEDISKIFSTFDVVNNLVGKPVNKYRDEYSDLESLSRVYFDRLGDSLNFTNFFNLFRWFDKKLSDSIKQLLPARVKFIGGEQVVESHFLERNRYGYKYPIFRTPKEPQEGEIDISPTFSASLQKTIEAQNPFVSAGGNTVFESQKSEGIVIDPRSVSAYLSANVSRSPKSTYSDGAERVDRMPENFFRIKVSGDNKEEINDSSSGINFKNEFARRLLSDKDRDNE